MSKSNWKEAGVPYREASERLPAAYLDWPDHGHIRKPADDFEAVLCVSHQERGMSAARVILKDRNNGTEYPMHLGDFVDLVANKHQAAPGTYDLTWKFVKKGQNYGIAAA